MRIRLLPLSLERDEGEFAYGGQFVLDGISPYKYLYTMKLPGIYAAYAVVMKIFGQTCVGIHMGLLIVNALAIIMVYLLGRRLIDAYAGVIAAASYAILSTSTAVLGFAGHATHYVVFFALAGMLVFLRALDRKTWAIPELALSGLLLGMSILMKQSGFFYGAFAALWLLWVDLRARPIGKRRLIARVGSFCICLAIPLIVTWALLTMDGLYKQSVFWNFTYANVYAHEMPDAARKTGHFATYLWSGCWGPTYAVISKEPGMWIAGCCGLLVLLWRRVPSRVFLACFTLFAAVAVSPGLWFRPHYFVQFLPALALLVGAFCWTLVRATGNGPISRWVVGAAFAGLLVFTVIPQQKPYFHDNMIQVSRRQYGFSPFPESIQVADYIRTHSSPTDTIAVVGSEPQIFFYAHRRSATGYIYLYPLEEDQKYALAMQQQAFRELDASNAKFLVYVANDGGWHQTPQSTQALLDWSRSVAMNYNVVEIADSVHWKYLTTIKGDAAVHFRRRPGETFIALCQRSGT
ncbi:MAG: ArnT family glycosyltransferase [Capsulimonadaceae bacterium]